jgi:hypothetical protein
MLSSPAARAADFASSHILSILIARSMYLRRPNNVFPGMGSSPLAARLIPPFRATALGFCDNSVENRRLGFRVPHPFGNEGVPFKKMHCGVS